MNFFKPFKRSIHSIKCLPAFFEKTKLRKQQKRGNQRNNGIPVMRTSGTEPTAEAKAEPDIQP